MLAIVMIVPMIPTFGISANAADVSTYATDTDLSAFSVPGLSVAVTQDATNNGTARWTAASANSISASLVGSYSTKKILMWTYHTYAVSSTTLTFTSSLPSEAVFQFDYATTLTDGTVKLGNTSLTGSGTYEGTIAANGTVTLNLSVKKKEGTDNTPNDASITITNIRFFVDGQTEVTFEPAAEGGSYTVGGETVSATTKKTYNATDKVNLVATPASGYSFSGWYSAEKGWLSADLNYTTNFEEAQTITAVFIPTADAIFGVGDARFDDLTAASSCAASSTTKVVVLLKDATITGDHTVALGSTLLIPYEATNKCPTTDPVSTVIGNSTSKAAPKVYRTLTLASGASITVQGEVSVAAEHVGGQAGSVNIYGGAVKDTYGCIQLNSGSTLTVGKGGTLYAWGYVLGSGRVNVLSGGAVYEKMQITDFRGGSNTFSIVSDGKGIFPFNQYYVQNVEAPVTLNHGAKLVAHAALVISGSDVFAAGVDFIGGDKGMFEIPEGASVTKRYDGTTDRLIFDTEGDVAMKSLILNINDVPLLGSLNVDSANYVLPINGNITININSGMANIKQNILMQPGTQVNVDSDAILVLGDPNTGASYSVYVMDSENWGKYAFSGKTHEPVYFAPSRSGNPRKTAALTDAQVNINGMLMNMGALYTSANGASIISSEGTGIIFMMANAPAAGTVGQYTGDKTATNINVNPAQLKNGNADTPFTSTAGAAMMDIFLYDTLRDMWMKPTADFTLSFDANGGTGAPDSVTVTLEGLQGMTESHIMQIPDGIPTMNNATFKGWALTVDGAVVVIPGQTVVIGQNTILYAVWEKSVVQFAVTFKDADGNLIYVIDLDEGTDPTYKGATLTKAADVNGHYTFAGWRSSVDGQVYTTLPAVTADTTYYAVFTATAHADTDKVATDGKHYCDACGYLVYSCKNANETVDHVCDYGCGRVLSNCADNDNDHNCDVCGNELTTCADNDNDHNCDVCGEQMVCSSGYLTQQAGQSATCGADGWNAYYKCSCGKLYANADATGEITDLAAWKTGAGKIPATGNHVYDNACDAECNVCRATREVGDHVYDNACDTDCNECGDIREVGAHVYDNDCDADCNECGDTREVGDHVPYDDDGDCTTDIICSICYAVTTAGKADHSFNTKASSQQVTPADCDNAATYYVQCDNCDAVNYEMTVAVGDALGHGHTNGLRLVRNGDGTHNVVCNDCETETEINKTCTVDESKTEENVYYPATCCDVGQKQVVKYCACNGVIYDEVEDIPAEGEHNLQYVPQADPSCLFGGCREYWYCTNGYSYFEDAAGKVKIDNINAWCSEDGKGYIPKSETHTGYQTARYIDSFSPDHRIVCSLCEEVWDAANPTAPHEVGEDGYCACDAFVYTLDYNGGKWNDATSEIEYVLGGMYYSSISDLIEAMSALVVKDGYKIVGLAHDAEGDDPYVEGEAINKTTTLYLIWECTHDKTVHNYTYTDNGDGSTHTVKCSCGETINEAEAHDYTTGATGYTCACGAVQTVNFTIDANGGSGWFSVGSQIGDTHDFVTLMIWASSNITREGYKLVGLTTVMNDPSTMIVEDGYKIPNVDSTIYCYWEVNTFTITYHSNGGFMYVNDQVIGHGSYPFTYDWNENVVAKADEVNGFEFKVYYPTRVFAGWNTKADGTGTAYAIGTSIELTENITLYAQYKDIAVDGVALNSGEYLDCNGNVTTTKPEGGYAYYNNGTLTLNNFVGTGGKYATSVVPKNMGVYTDTDLIVVLEGSNFLESTSYGIYCYDLTIRGDGSLTITAGNIAICTVGEVTIESGNIILHGYAALYAEENITISGGTVTGTGYLYSYGGALNLDGVVVISPAGTTFDQYDEWGTENYLLDSNGKLVTSFKIGKCEHTEKSYTDLGNGSHEVTCKICSETVKEDEAHNFKTADYTCVCGLECSHIGLALGYAKDDGTHDVYCGSCNKFLVNEPHTYMSSHYCMVCIEGRTGWYNDCYYVNAEVLKTGWTEIENAWYYLNTETGIRAEGITRVPYPEVVINGITYAPDAETLAYCESKDIEFIDADEAWFLFGDDGKFLYDTDGDIEWYEINGVNALRYMKHGMLKWHPGLIKTGNGYYFIGDVVNGGNIAAEGDTYITRNNGIEAFKIGDIYNFANGQLSGYNGIVDGKYYENSKLMAGNGLTKVGDNYIYVRSNGYIVKNTEFWVNGSEYDIVTGIYTFDENGYMTDVKTTDKNGIFFEDGGYFYYVDGVKSYEGLIQYTGTASDGTEYTNNWIYVRSNGQLATGEYWITKTNDNKDAKEYNFNATGAMIETTGIIEENGSLYYYVEGILQQCAGLINIDGNYYYVRTNGEVVNNRSYWITNVNDFDIEPACYNFDANGVMQLTTGIVEENDALYYYVDGQIAAGAGLVELDDGSIIYVRSNGQLATGEYWPTTLNGVLPAGKYTFGEDGKLVTE